MDKAEIVPLGKRRLVSSQMQITIPPEVKPWLSDLKAGEYLQFYKVGADIVLKKVPK